MTSGKRCVMHSGVSTVGYGRHDSCHGRHFDGGANAASQKLKFVTCGFFNPYCAPHTTINYTAASKQRPSIAIIRACCANTKHCNKTVVLWHSTTVRHCDKTRMLPFNISALDLDGGGPGAQAWWEVPCADKKCLDGGWSMKSLVFPHIINVYDVILWRHVC